MTDRWHDMFGGPSLVFKMFNNQYGISTVQSEPRLGVNDQDKNRRPGPAMAQVQKVWSSSYSPNEAGFGRVEISEAVLVQAWWMALKPGT